MLGFDFNSILSVSVMVVVSSFFLSSNWQLDRCVRYMIYHISKFIIYSLRRNNFCYTLLQGFGYERATVVCISFVNG